MESWMGRYAADYSTLGFDVEKHREAFRAFADLDLDPLSVPAALIAREQVVRVFPAATFQIGCALIIGKRNAQTDLKTSLNDVLREFEIGA